MAPVYRGAKTGLLPKIALIGKVKRHAPDMIVCPAIVISISNITLVAFFRPRSPTKTMPRAFDDEIEGNPPKLSNT
jgi:hypothetical protein